MKIYLMRHGETAWNAENKLQGHSDIPLNEKGIELAKRTGQALKDIPFEAAYSSPLIRAIQTAQIVMEGKGVPVQTDDRLKEMGFGVLEGIHHREKEHSEFLRTLNRDTIEYQAPEGGETFAQVEERVYDFFCELVQKKELADSYVLVTSHGAAIRGLMNKLFDGGDISRFWGNGVHKNCAVSILNVDGGGNVNLEADGKIFYSIGQ